MTIANIFTNLEKIWRFPRGENVFWTYYSNMSYGFRRSNQLGVMLRFVKKQCKKIIILYFSIMTTVLENCYKDNFKYVLDRSN